MITAGTIVALLQQHGVTPTRVKASVVGGVGITVLLPDGFVYIELQQNNVMAGRAYLGSRAPEIVFLGEVEGDLSRLVRWAADKASRS